MSKIENVKFGSEDVDDGRQEVPSAPVGHQVAELKIPVPWGHIAVKTWNHPSGIPVLALHGSMDNCGTFDRLIPQLPTSHYYVCVDLPGHGLSSHFPAGLLLDFFDFVKSVLLVADHFAWERFTLMGHSFGGQVCAVFTALHPQRVQRLVMLDSMAQYALSMDEFRLYYRHCANRLVELDSEMEPPSHSYEEALHRMINKRVDKITVDAARHLLVRGLVKTSKGYGFSVDPRMKIFVPVGFGSNQTGLTLLEHINCPQLTIITDYLKKRMATRKEFQKAFEILGKRANVVFVEVEGHHDIHSISPEKVSGDISQFLIKQTSML